MSRRGDLIELNEEALSPATEANRRIGDGWQLARALMLANPGDGHADAHRHYLSDNAEPILTRRNLASCVV